MKKKNTIRWTSVLVLTVAVAAFFGAWQFSSPAKVAASGGKFRIRFDYSKAEKPELFTEPVKADIEAAARLLENFIDNDHEVVITVVSDETMKDAFATAAPSEWQESTEENPIEKPLVIKGGIRFNASILRKFDGDESSNVALTVHELFHAIGFVRGSKAVNALVKNNQFTGAMAMKMNGGKPVPLSSDGHFPQGFKDPVGVEPRMNVGGGGSYFSAVELGVLADLGYDIPVLNDANGAMFLNYKLDGRYADKQPDGSYLLDGTGGNDVIFAGKGKFKIRGAGGDDILVSGDGVTEMEGDDNPMMPPDYRSGKDGKDTFVVRKGEMVTIADLGADDTLLISPATGVTQEALEEALADPQKFRNMPVPGNPNAFRPGVWLLEVGDFKIGIGTKDKKKPTKLDNVRIEDWSGE